jgi:hypothetical protein
MLAAGGLESLDNNAYGQICDVMVSVIMSGLKRQGSPCQLSQLTSPGEISKDGRFGKVVDENH